jgi:hypothetical protein
MLGSFGDGVLSSHASLYHNSFLLPAVTLWHSGLKVINFIVLFSRHRLRNPVVY